MNQCSVLCVGENANIAHDTVRARLNMLQTTSPSYVLLGSCDYALGYMREHGHTELAMTINLVEDNVEDMLLIESLGGNRANRCQLLKESLPLVPCNHSPGIFLQYHRRLLCSQ